MVTHNRWGEARAAVAEAFDPPTGSGQAPQTVHGGRRIGKTVPAATFPGAATFPRREEQDRSGEGFAVERRGSWVRRLQRNVATPNSRAPPSKSSPHSGKHKQPPPGLQLPQNLVRGSKWGCAYTGAGSHSRAFARSSATSTIMSSCPPTMRRLPNSTRMSRVSIP